MYVIKIFKNKTIGLDDLSIKFAGAKKNFAALFDLDPSFPEKLLCYMSDKEETKHKISLVLRTT